MIYPWVRRRTALARCFASAALVLAVVVAFALPSAAPAQAPNRVLLTEISGVIGVATTRQLSRAIDQAQDQKAAVLIVRLDTPGGLVTSTRDLIQRIVASPVPVVVYVAPSGARAASAGTFLVYASHIAAMAPGTNIGAATPVQIGGVPALPEPRQTDPAKEERNASPTKPRTTAEQKALNDSVALLRSLAQLRGRNAEWADRATRDAETLTATEAQKEGVIEIVATTVDDLLAQLDGRRVSVAGAEIVLATRNSHAELIAPDVRTRLLSVISDPNIAFILLMIGFYGLILEFWHPGTWVPGVIGGISLILALVGLTALPVNYGALGLLVLGLALMVGEAFTPGVGVLGIGGLAAFIAGAYFLFENAGSDVDIAVSLPLIIGTAVVSVLLIFGIAAAALKARRRPAATGAEQLVGADATVVDWDGTCGHVRLFGEVWSARSSRAMKPTGRVRVTGRDGLTLIVEN
ncbi:nodulation protein NfeD [Bradyrhizobium sp. LHD-71]|uniref:NfeD family protein n=1 Tax=Bradyrhizobium sp. LHD-71 TaxID=3072141 RepID=UPI00280D3B5C|nr:nodulation protein NfeD [Bradyrhizobium sp. LHD-71]MDQ8726092.1 nodulation protein NfeD [Bradyrhizobium sp. LHD-71]